MPTSATSRSKKTKSMLSVPAESRPAITKAALNLLVLLGQRGALDFELLAGMSGLGALAVAKTPPPPPKTYSPNDIISPAEAAGLTGLAAKTLANYRSKGTGPVFIKTGNLIHYRYADLLAFIEKNKRSSTSDMGVNHD